MYLDVLRVHYVISTKDAAYISQIQRMQHNHRDMKDSRHVAMHSNDSLKTQNIFGPAKTCQDPLQEKDAEIWNNRLPCATMCYHVLPELHSKSRRLGISRISTCDSGSGQMEWQACEDQELADLVAEHASQSHQFVMFCENQMHVLKGHGVIYSWMWIFA